MDKTTTREREQARLCANLTDNLPHKIEAIAKALVKQMREANRGNLYADFYVDGTINSLLFLDIPCRAHKDGDAYRAVEIAGEMFPVAANERG